MPSCKLLPIGITTTRMREEVQLLDHGSHSSDRAGQGCETSKSVSLFQRPPLVVVGMTVCLVCTEGKKNLPNPNSRPLSLHIAKCITMQLFKGLDVKRKLKKKDNATRQERPDHLVLSMQSQTGSVPLNGNCA